jgi:hypothetical protein
MHCWQRRATDWQTFNIVVNGTAAHAISMSRLRSCSVRGFEVWQHSLEHPTGRSLMVLGRVTLVEHRCALYRTTRCVQRPRPLHLFGEVIQSVETTRYLGITRDTRLTWSAHVNRVGRKGILGPSLTGGVVCPSETACCSTSSSSVPWWTTHVPSGGRLPTLTLINYNYCNPSVFELRLTHPGSNRQIHEDFGLPFFADHIRALTESFDSKLADAGNPLVRQLGRHFCQPRAGWSHPRLTEEGWRSAGQSRQPLKRRPSRHSD